MRESLKRAQRANILTLLSKLDDYEPETIPESIKRSKRCSATANAAFASLQRRATSVKAELRKHADSCKSLQACIDQHARYCEGELGLARI